MNHRRSPFPVGAIAQEAVAALHAIEVPAIAAVQDLGEQAVPALRVIGRRP